MMTLDDSQLANLDKYYNSSNKEYRALVQRYLDEKKQARRMRKLKELPGLPEWSPREGPSLTPEMVMRTGPTPEALKLPYGSFNDKHERTIRLTSKEVDERNSGCVSSFVYLCMSEEHKETRFGRILFIFRHTFVHSTSLVAYVILFRDVQNLIIYCIVQIFITSIQKRMF